MTRLAGLLGRYLGRTPRTARPTSAPDADLIDTIRFAAQATTATPERLTVLGAPAMAAFRLSAATSGGIRTRRPMQFRPSPRRLAMALPALALIVGLTTAATVTTVAATGPGQALYPARLSLESAILVGFGGSSSSSGQLTWLERRLDEAESAAHAGSEAALESALNAYVAGVAELSGQAGVPVGPAAERLDAQIQRLKVLETTADAGAYTGTGASGTSPSAVQRAIHAAASLRRSVLGLSTGPSAGRNDGRDETPSPPRALQGAVPLER